MLLALALAVAVIAAVRGLWSPCGLSMITQLNPVAERGRGYRFAPTAAWYVAGALAGGLLTAAVTGLGAGLLSLAHPSRTATFTALAVLALLAVASDLPAVPFALPDHPRQVNEEWLGRYRRWIYAGGFGAQIGTGFATYIMSSAVYLMAALAVLTAHPAQAVLVALSFAGVRGLTVLMAGAANTPERLWTIMARVDACEPASRATCLGIEALAAVAGAVVLLTDRQLAAFAAVAAVAVLLGLAALLAPAATRRQARRPAAGPVNA